MERYDRGELTAEEAARAVQDCSQEAAAPPTTVTASISATPTLPIAAAIPATVEAQPEQKHLPEKLYMLELINQERIKAGAAPVTLSQNPAPQIHADNALAGCFGGHWGLDGTKPYMRYSLAGGYQGNGENSLGNHFCVPSYFAANAGILTEIADAMRSWMGSPGHRRNILDPFHKKVSIGLAWDRHNIRFYQNFEGDYVGYTTLPNFKGGILSMAGKVKNGVRFRQDRDLGVQIYYDPPPAPLTRGQLSRTGCYEFVQQVASLRWPAPPGSYWPRDTDTFVKDQTPRCRDPRNVDPATHPPKPSIINPRYPWPVPPAVKTVIPRITASGWIAAGTNFAVTADLGSILAEYGPGVYSVVVWADFSGKDEIISEYSIFHEIDPPDGYGE